MKKPAHTAAAPPMANSILARNTVVVVVIVHPVTLNNVHEANYSEITICIYDLFMTSHKQGLSFG